MKLLKKLLKLLRLFVLLAIAAIIFLFVSGYTMYKKVTDTISLNDKVASIEANKNYTTYDKLPQNYINAVIAIEDHRFKEHNGIDYISLCRAIITNIINFDLVEGGSTITQQVSKNLYFTQEKKLTRKIAEAFVAHDLETNYSKEKIFELYVNTNYFGSGYYGVYNAAKGYFDTEPINLSSTQCMLLAGIPNAPSIYSLDVNPDLAYERARQVIQAMEKYGYKIENN